MERYWGKCWFLKDKVGRFSVWCRVCVWHLWQAQGSQSVINRPSVIKQRDNRHWDTLRSQLRIKWPNCQPALVCVCGKCERPGRPGLACLVPLLGFFAEGHYHYHHGALTSLSPDIRPDLTFSKLFIIEQNLNIILKFPYTLLVEENFSSPQFS